MVNVNLLKGKIVEKGLNIEKIAESIQVNKSTLYRKLKDGGNSITVREAELIVSVLNLSKEEAHAIFFARHVA